MLSLGLLDLSPAGSKALVTAITSATKVPDTVEGCVAFLLDVMMTLTKRRDLPPHDLVVLLKFCQSDQRLLTLARLMLQKGPA